MLGLAPVAAARTSVLSGPVPHAKIPVDHNVTHGSTGVTTASPSHPHTLVVAPSSGVETNVATEYTLIEGKDFGEKAFGEND